MPSPGEEGKTIPVRQHYQNLARRGSAFHQRKLDSVPPCPEELEYLVKLARSLHARSGAWSGGVLPLSPSVLRDWCILMDEHLTPLEVDALLQLDAARLYPGKAEGPEQVKPKIPADERWPKGENGG